MIKLLVRGLAACVALAVAAPPAHASPPAASKPASAITVPVLPRPTGPHPVGATDLHLVDSSRADPWAPQRRRELMVTLRYPARSQSGVRTRYMTPAESALMLAAQGVEGVPPDLLSRIRTHARAGARPLRSRLPLVVLSPGFGLPRSSLTTLSEELASRGYAVATVGHPYEATATTLPDGTTVPCKACEIEDSPSLVPAIRSADVSFLIGRLTGAHPAWGPRGLVDASKIGMAGHSIGGNSAAKAMADDPRIDAGLVMDGAFIVPLPPTGLARPFMLFGTEGSFLPGGPDEETSWRDNWPRLTGWKRWATVAGAEHESFTDYPVLSEQLGLPPGALPAARAIPITRSYVRAFFDLHLRHIPTPLLNRPSPAYPEVRFWKNL
ncbi:alpha/beta hydrolase family protein [Streptosporangium saharense]|uniref:alpha/beta hydrolase family protein n=1 Tax=Streptosporangium saharense TaxID=1706840 RepID=UPI0034443FFF